MTWWHHMIVCRLLGCLLGTRMSPGFLKVLAMRFQMLDAHGQGVYCSVSCGQRNPLHGGQGLQSLRGPSRFKQTCLENSASWICISRTKRDSQWVSCFIAWYNGRSKVLKALNASCSGYLFFLRAHRQLTKLRILSNESLHGTADTVHKCSFGSSLRQWASRASASSTRWVFKLRGETGLSEGRGFKVVKCRQVVWIHAFPCRSACWLDGVPLAKGETRTASMAQNKSIWRLPQVCHAALRVPHFKS